MGRTRTRSKKETSGTAKALFTEENKREPSLSSLLEKVQSLLVECDYDLAGRFVRRVLEREPNNVQAKELLGVVQLETGDIIGAKSTFGSLLPPRAGAPLSPPPSAHLYLAQLSDGPHEALQHYQAAVDILNGQLKGKERATDPLGTNDDEKELRQNIVRALIGMVEVWMDPSYDLCFDPSAEKTCEDLLNNALQVDPNNTEALQTMASVRLSQQRPDDAKVCVEQAWAQWKDLEPDDVRLPPIPSRLSLVKLFLELSLFTPALLVLHGIMAVDDQEVEAWYLEGWCFVLMAERAQGTGGRLDDLTWEELARDARDCLETCQTLHENQDHPDKPLLGHARELIVKLEASGVYSSTEEADDNDDGWEDAECSEDEDDGDIEMS